MNRQLANRATAESKSQRQVVKPLAPGNTWSEICDVGETPRAPSSLGGRRNGAPRGSPVQPVYFNNSSRKGKSGRSKGGRNRTRKGGKDLFDYGREAYNLVRKVISEINVELKATDVSFSGLSSSSAGVIYNLTNVAQGIDWYTRDGDSILLQAIQWRYTVTVGGTPQAAVRFIVFADNDNRGVDPTVAEVLQNLTVYSPLLYYVDLAKDKRYTIIFDDVVTVATNWQPEVHKEHEKMLHRHVFFQSVNGADASNYKGAMFLLVITDAGSLQPTFSGTSRIYFTDN